MYSGARGSQVETCQKASLYQYYNAQRNILSSLSSCNFPTRTIEEVCAPPKWLGSNAASLRGIFEFPIGCNQNDRFAQATSLGVEEGSNNPFTDLGLPDAEALFAKAGIAYQISQAIEARGLKMKDAAKTVGMSEEQMTQMLRGQFQDIERGKMLDCLACLQ